MLQGQQLLVWVPCIPRTHVTESALDRLYTLTSRGSSDAVEMAVMGREIIEIVLRHLQNPLDLIACSVVSQGWYSAYQNAQISSLDLSIDCSGWRGTLSEAHLYGLAHWMQAQQARGNFCQLTDLTINFDEELGDRKEQYSFSGAVLMLAGTWPLQELEITGAFDFDLAVEMLPESVKHLKLCPRSSCFPDKVYLVGFTKFTALQTLTVFPCADDPMYQAGNGFFLGGALANVTSMTLSNWPFILKDGCSITDCLPMLEHASVHLHVDLVKPFTSHDVQERTVPATSAKSCL